MTTSPGKTTAARYPVSPILLVDDDVTMLRLMEASLRREGVDNVFCCADARRVSDLVSRNEYSVVSLDLSMPHVSGLDLLKEIAGSHPELTVVVVTAAYDLEMAIECVKLGAFDYIHKQTAGNDIVPRILRALQHAELLCENRSLRQSLLSQPLQNPAAFAGFATASPSMLNIFRYAEAIAKTGLTVLVTGETGVGKEVMAEAIHKASGRTGEFVTVNAAGLDDAMLSDTLFGHERGAFTGAERPRKGLIETAGGGTLFLDEIGDLAHESQVKLLRVLQDRKYYPVGSDVVKLSTARIIAATNRDLEDAMRKGTFRGDLYYRLKSHHIHIPPLRERLEDIPALVEAFARAAAKETGSAPPAIPERLFAIMRRHSFPGNVRELQGMVFDAVSRGAAAGETTLSFEAFRSGIPPEPEPPSAMTASAAVPATDVEFHFPEQLPELEAWEDLLIDEAMHRANGNKTLAAKMLGVSRQALHTRLRKKSPSPDGDGDPRGDERHVG